MDVSPNQSPLEIARQRVLDAKAEYANAQEIENNSAFQHAKALASDEPVWRIDILYAHLQGARAARQRALEAFQHAVEVYQSVKSMSKSARKPPPSVENER